MYRVCASPQAIAHASQADSAQDGFYYIHTGANSVKQLYIVHHGGFVSRLGHP